MMTTIKLIDGIGSGELSAKLSASFNVPESYRRLVNHLFNKGHTSRISRNSRTVYNKDSDNEILLIHVPSADLQQKLNNKHPNRGSFTLVRIVLINGSDFAVLNNNYRFYFRHPHGRTHKDALKLFRFNSLDYESCEQLIRAIFGIEQIDNFTAPTFIGVTWLLTDSWTYKYEKRYTVGISKHLVASGLYGYINFPYFGYFWFYGSGLVEFYWKKSFIEYTLNEPNTMDVSDIFSVFCSIVSNGPLCELVKKVQKFMHWLYRKARVVKIKGKLEF